MDRITKKEIDALLDEIDARAVAAEKRKAAFQVAVRKGMEAAGLKYMIADEPDSPELNARLTGTVSAWLDAELEAGVITQEQRDQTKAALEAQGWRAVFHAAAGFLFGEQAAPTATPVAKRGTRRTARRR
jgi:hypothetical protein